LGGICTPIDVGDEGGGPEEGEEQDEEAVLEGALGIGNVSESNNELPSIKEWIGAHDPVAPERDDFCM
jgi:hypothetical protein